MKILLGFILVIIVLFLILQGELNERNNDLPVFMKTDLISQEHHSEIKIIVKSKFKPSDYHLLKLKEDYSNLWAHLNHLYQSNDVIAGKEYYTENWFKFICNHQQNEDQQAMIRTDSIHHLNILNWSSDNLVCTAIDSNIVLSYKNPERKEKATIALVLLYQGDHWRLDALRVLNIESLNP